jgi:hypothetical protein
MNAFLTPNLTRLDPHPRYEKSPFFFSSILGMYHRRGLGQAQGISDQDARDTNFTLMQRKRKQQLEEQLEAKLELLKQYTNPRGIGMRGQTVRQEDVQILQNQIEQIQQQLQQITNPAGSAQSQPPVSNPAQMVSSRDNSAFSQGQMSSGSRQPQQPQQPQQYQQAPQNSAPQSFGVPGPASGPLDRLNRNAPSASSSRQLSKREEVWEKKYQNWLERASTRGASSLMSAPKPQPPQTSTASAFSYNSSATHRSEVHPLVTPTGVGQPQTFHEPPTTWAGKDLPPQPQYGRRATPQQTQRPEVSPPPPAQVGFGRRGTPQNNAGTRPW